MSNKDYSEVQRLLAAFCPSQYFQTHFLTGLGLSYTQSNTFHKFLAVRCPDTNSRTGTGSNPR